jgi:O-antigen ligase
MGSRVLSRAHRVLLVAYALLVGLVEGPAQIAAVLVLLTTLATGGLRGFRPGPAELGILIWVLAGVPGLLLDPGRYSSADTTRPLLALTFLIGSNAIGRADAAMLRRMAWAFSIACVINATYGALQYAAGELPWDSVFLKNPRSAQLYIPGRVYHVRAASGLFYNRLKLAHVAMVGAFLIAMIAFAPHVRARVRAMAAAGGAVLGAGLALTYARMAFLAVVASFVALAGVLRRWVVLATAATISLVALGGVLFSEDGRRRITSLDEDLTIRRQMFDAALQIFSDHPILGVGHGVYRNAIAELGDVGLTGVHLTSPHNLWLQLLAETGVAGFLGFNAALAWCLWQVMRRIRRARTDPDRAILDRLALTGVLAISFVGLLHFSLHHAPVGLVFWTLAGVCVRSEEHGEAT